MFFMFIMFDKHEKHQESTELKATLRWCFTVSGLISRFYPSDVPHTS